MFVELVNEWFGSLIVVYVAEMCLKSTKKIIVLGKTPKVVFLVKLLFSFRSRKWDDPRKPVRAPIEVLFAPSFLLLRIVNFSVQKKKKKKICIIFEKFFLLQKWTWVLTKYFWALKFHMICFARLGAPYLNGSPEQ